jgi:hypothetical protein
MEIHQIKENNYIREILDEICQTVFSAKLASILDINFELHSIKSVVNIGDETLYIKFSSVQSFIKKDYDIKWVLQDLDISLEPIKFGYLKTRELYYSIFNFNKINFLKEEKIEANSILDSISKYHSIKVQKNNNIENYKDFFLKRYTFDNFYYIFPTSLKEDFLNLTYQYGEIYEKLESKVNKNLFNEAEAVLLHGDIGENSIAKYEKNIVLYNFENSFYGHPAIDICFFDINLKYDKKTFLQKNFTSESLNLEILLNFYELCLLKKGSDFIFDVVFSFFSKEINSRDKMFKNSLNLNFFSQIEDVKLINKSISNIINHSNA